MVMTPRGSGYVEHPPERKTAETWGYCRYLRSVVEKLPNRGLSIKPTEFFCVPQHLLRNQYIPVNLSEGWVRATFDIRGMTLQDAAFCLCHT